MQLVGHRATLVVLWLVGALLLESGVAMAQDEPESPAEDGATAAETEAGPLDEAASDLWLLGSQETVTRLDGETGEVVDQLDVTNEECYWEQLVGPADGAIWLTDLGDPGNTFRADVERSRFCIGRFPTDGSEPQIFWFEPGKARFGITGAVILGDVLWMASSIPSSGGAVYPTDHGLFRLDLSGGVEGARLEKVLPAMATVGLLDDALVVGQMEKGRFQFGGVRSKYGYGWRPASFTPGAEGQPQAIDVGLKKKETLAKDGGSGSGILAGDGLVGYRDSKVLIVHDPATGAVTRPKVGRFFRDWALVLTGGGIWTVPGAGAHLQVLPLEGGPPEVVSECSPMAYDFGATCPLIVGATPGAIWVLSSDLDEATGEVGPLTLHRFDTATREATHELDASSFIDPDDVWRFQEMHQGG